MYNFKSWKVPLTNTEKNKDTDNRISSEKFYINKGRRVKPYADI